MNKKCKVKVKTPVGDTDCFELTDIDKVLTLVSVPGVTRGAVLVSGLRPALLPASLCVHCLT